MVLAAVSVGFVNTVSIRVLLAGIVNVVGTIVFIKARPVIEYSVYWWCYAVELVTYVIIMTPMKLTQTC